MDIVIIAAGAPSLGGYMETTFSTVPTLDQVIMAGRDPTGVGDRIGVFRS
jgi:hypothetical protein